MADGARICFRKISAIAARCLSATRHSVIKGSGPLALCCRFQRRPAAHDRNVRFGSKADMQCTRRCLLCADSGHCANSNFISYSISSSGRPIRLLGTAGRERRSRSRVSYTRRRAVRAWPNGGLDAHDRGDPHCKQHPDRDDDDGVEFHRPIPAAPVK